MRHHALIKAIEIAGSVKAIADACGVTSQNVSQWRKIPPRHCLMISEITGIPLHVLREDVYPAPVHAQLPLEVASSDAAA